MIPLVLFIPLTLIWIGAVGLDTFSTLRFINRLGWRWEGNYIPRKIFKRAFRDGKWGGVIALMIFYLSIVPIWMVLVPFLSLIQLFFPITMTIIVYFVGIWNLFVHDRINKTIKRGSSHTLFGEHKEIKTWKLSGRIKKIKHFKDL